MKRANEIIAATLGMDLPELNATRYQSTRTALPVYAIGEQYFCCPCAGQNTVGKMPKGFDWREYPDQFFAQREGRLIYVSPTVDEGKKEAVFEGFEIKGNDGVDVYPRSDGYYVEHFRVLTLDETVIVNKIGPFSDEPSARDILRAYRERWLP